MVHAEYLPNNLAGMLDHCVEEFGEALAALGKFQRFGPHSTHPDGGRTNLQGLLEELHDARGAIDRALVGIRSTFPPM